MLTLYYSPHTRAGRVRWLLEELGVPHELKRLVMKEGDHKKPDYLKINPHGTIPSFTDDKVTLTESAAICLYLADKFLEKGMAPALNSADRPTYLNWIFFAIATLEPPIITVFQQTKQLPEEKRAAVTLQEANKNFRRCAHTLTQALEGKEFILGKTFSTADILLGSLLEFARAMKLLGDFPQLENYAKNLTGRPAYQRSRVD